MRQLATFAAIAACVGCAPTGGGSAPAHGPLAEFAHSIEWDDRSCVQVTRRVIVEGRAVARICTGNSDGALGYLTFGPGDTVLSASLEWRPGPAHLDSVAALTAMRLATGFPGAVVCRQQRASTLYGLKTPDYIATLEIDSVQGRVGEYRTLGSFAACGVLSDSSATYPR